MANIPYVRPPYDSSASTARMSDLMRMRGAVAANAERQQGAANAYLWGNLINTAGNTMSDLVKYQAAKPEMELRKAQTARLTREERKAFEEDEIGRQTAGLPLEQRTEIASGYGRQDVADKYAEQHMALETKRLQLEEFKGKRIADEFTKAGDVIRLAMTQEVPPERRQTAWTEGRTRLAKALDLTPEDMASIPEAVPTDPAVLNRYLEMTMTARERADSARAAAVALKDSRKDDADYTQYLSTHVAAASNEQEFNAIRDMAKARGKGELFSSLFGAAYTPEAVAYAQRSLTVGKGEGGKGGPGTLADMMETKARELNTTVDKLTSSQKLQIKAQYEAAGRAPEKGETPFKDNPKFPTGVDNYLSNMRNRGYTREQAESELARVDLRKDHPNLSGLEVQKALDVYWPLRPPVYDLAGNPVAGTRELKPPVRPNVETPSLGSLAQPPVAAPAPAAPTVAPGLAPQGAVAQPGPTVESAKARQEAEAQARAQALITEIQGLERQGQAKSPLYAQRLAELRRILAG